MSCSNYIECQQAKEAPYFSCSKSDFVRLPFYVKTLDSRPVNSDQSKKVFMDQMKVNQRT